MILKDEVSEMAKKIKKKISQEEQEMIFQKKRKKSIIVGSVFAVLIVGWLVYAVTDAEIMKVKNARTDVNFNSIMEYIEGLSE